MANKTVSVEWSFIAVCIIGFLCNGLLLWLLFYVHMNKAFTAYYIRINLVVFHMLVDVLLISKSILVLNGDLTKLEQFCTLYTNIEPAFTLNTALNNFLLAVNHYCLHNSHKKRIFSAFISRGKTLVYILSTWITIVIYMYFVRQPRYDHALEVNARYGFRCGSPLPMKYLIPTIVVGNVIMVINLLINYCIYRSIASWLKKNNFPLPDQTQARATLRSLRSSLILTVWILAILFLVSVVDTLIIFFAWKSLYILEVILRFIFLFTVQLNALVAQVLTDQRSRGKLKKLMLCFKRRPARVGVFTEAEHEEQL